MCSVVWRQQLSIIKRPLLTSLRFDDVVAGHSAGCPTNAPTRLALMSWSSHLYTMFPFRSISTTSTSPSRQTKHQRLDQERLRCPSFSTISKSSDWLQNHSCGETHATLSKTMPRGDSVAGVSWKVQWRRSRTNFCGIVTPLDPWTGFSCSPVRL